MLHFIKLAKCLNGLLKLSQFINLSQFIKKPKKNPIFSVLRVDNRVGPTRHDPFIEGLSGLCRFTRLINRS